MLPQERWDQEFEAARNHLRIEADAQHPMAFMRTVIDHARATGAIHCREGERIGALAVLVCEALDRTTVPL